MRRVKDNCSSELNRLLLTYNCDESELCTKCDIKDCYLKHDEFVTQIKKAKKAKKNKTNKKEFKAFLKEFKTLNKTFYKDTTVNNKYEAWKLLEKKYRFFEVRYGISKYMTK
ncbi:hypothetical protein RJG79_02495 [Mycoplasmatota bacterium WC44]